MEKLLKVWTYLSGKKTVTAAVLKALADVFTAAGWVAEAAIIDQIANALLALGLTHKVVKI